MNRVTTSARGAPPRGRLLNSKSLRGLDAAEADGVAAVARVLVMTVRRTAGIGAVGPRAPAQHALLRRLLVPRAAVRRGVLVVVVPGVRGPLPDVAMHVIQAPRIRLLLADRRVLAFRVAIEPAMILQIVL